MKQKKLLMNLYQANINHDTSTAEDLYKKEFKKIFKRKAKGKSFSTRWTLIR